MAKFKQVTQNFLVNKIMGFWGNMVKNYDGDIHNDFFNIISKNFDHDKAVELIEAAYSKKALDDMRKARSRACRLDLSDSLDCVFQSLWNTAKANAKCRVILAGIKDCISEEKQGDDEDPIETRFSDLKRLLRLSDLESEILLVAYAQRETCFDWPRRVESREKPLFYAMALDRSFAEISHVMTAKSKLRKFNLLDRDWDFNCRTFSGYIDGTADAIERQFYRKSEETDILPWAFYGELAKRDGETVKRMLEACEGKLNILLYGAPGTGKSEFCKYLGKTLDRKVLVVKGSDLLSKWVGESEQNIARAFRRAEAERAILFFDEVDGLVQSREMAEKSWQVSQVNEILQQMENFEGVMVAATNFCKNLDPAIMRRFTFKLEFDYLDDEGKRIFFERMFKTTMTDAEFAELKTLQNLAPGDYRTVRQEQFYLADEQSNGDRIEALREECAIKKDGNKTVRIGFAA